SVPRSLNSRVRVGSGAIAPGNETMRHCWLTAELSAGQASTATGALAWSGLRLLGRPQVQWRCGSAGQRAARARASPAGGEGEAEGASSGCWVVEAEAAGGAPSAGGGALTDGAPPPVG